MDFKIGKCHFSHLHFFRFLSLCFFVLASQVQVQANQLEKEENTESEIEPDPFLLLAGINKANRSNNFRGLLTYEANGYISTMRLTQIVSDDTINQRLSFLDGPKRQVVRQKMSSNCAEAMSALQSWPHIEFDKLSKIYTIVFDGIERVADREAYAVVVMPKDNYRYGYRFSIDSETGLLLKTLLIADEKVIERLQFIELSPYTENDNDSSATIDVETYTQTLTAPISKPCRSNKLYSEWNANWLPEGFALLSHYVTDHDEQALVFSDGLATLSVFIVERRKSVPKAMARYGATVAVILPLKVADREYTTTVVGEIPMATARQIAVSVHPQ